MFRGWVDGLLALGAVLRGGTSSCGPAPTHLSAQAASASKEPPLQEAGQGTQVMVPTPHWPPTQPGGTPLGLRLRAVGCPKAASHSAKAAVDSGEVSGWRPLRVLSAGCLPPCTPGGPQRGNGGTFFQGPRAGGAAHKPPSLLVRSPRVGQSCRHSQPPTRDCRCKEGKPSQPAWVSLCTCGWAREGRRPLSQLRWSHTAAAGLLACSSTLSHTPPSRRHPGSQMLPLGPGV